MKFAGFNILILSYLNLFYKFYLVTREDKLPIFRFATWFYSVFNTRAVPINLLSTRQFTVIVLSVSILL